MKLLSFYMIIYYIIEYNKKTYAIMEMLDSDGFLENVEIVNYEGEEVCVELEEKILDEFANLEGEEDDNN